MEEAKIEEPVCEDMISALPEDLLVMILLLVPTKDAVATMILSKRWRFVWMLLPRLEFEENNDDDKHDDDESKKSIWWFVDKSLELHNAPVLAVLRIKLGARCPSDANVEKWIAKAVDRGVFVLEFELRWSAGPTRMPKSLYTCETLMKLTLSHKILVDFPSSSCLPSLELLELFYVVYKDEASLARFLSSCPVLLILGVRRMKDDNVTKFSVKVPSLCLFLYQNIMSLLDDNDAVNTGGCLVMDTPALTTFIIDDCSRDGCSMENMHSLENASIDIKYFHDIDKFITSFSAVLSLDLCLTDEVLPHCTTINFSRLKKLSIKPSRSDWLVPLLLLLENAPKLENLCVNYDFTFKPDDVPLSWNQPSSIPKCLSSQLEIFEWRGYGDREEEKEFLTYILAHSKCLKTATISLRNTFDLEEEDLIIELLKYIPRVSPSSQLLLK